MARQHPDEQPTPQSLSPYHTPPGGAPMPVPAAGPYGPNPGYTPYTPAAKAGPTPLGLLNALKRRWVLATFLGGLVAAVFATGVWMLMPAGKHQARAIVQLRTSAPDIGGKSSEEFDSFRRDQMFILKSRDLINRTLSEPAIASLDMVKNAEDAVRAMEEGFKVDTPSPHTMSLVLAGDNPEEIKALVDMQVKKYIDDATAFERRARDERLKKLETLADRLKAEIVSKEATVRRMAEANHTGGGEAFGAKLARMQMELLKLDGELFSTRKEVQELEINRELFKKKLDNKRVDIDPLDLSRLVNSDPRIADILKQRIIKEMILSRDRAKAEAGAPTIAALEADIERLDKEIAAARKAVEPEIRYELERMTEQQTRNKIADIDDRLASTRVMLQGRQKFRDDAEKSIGHAAVGGFNMDALMKELDPQRLILDKVETQRAMVQVERELDARVTIREPASVMLNQNLKQKTMLAAAAGIAGFFLVLAIVGYLEWRTRRIDGVDQVVTDLGMRVIGTVPAFPNKASLKAAEAAGNANWRFILNESINSTRTMLLHTARRESMQVVMVTSATQGEGKTSLASQLGTSMATAGMRTLIVDCDLRNPSIHKLFDLRLQVGVSEVLCEEADVSDAVQPTSVPNLWVIPAGQCSTRVITALAQGHPLETLFNRLRGQFDFIIVDSCPVLPVADALLIGQHVDGVVFSIMQDISQLPKVLVASEKLQQLNVPLLGAVVNGVSAGSAYYAYGYNYVKQLPA